MAEASFSEFVKSVKESLREGNTVHALSIFHDNKNSSEVKNNSWDLIPAICEFLTGPNEKDKKKIFSCCEKLLDILADNSNPEEALLQFIEELEEAEDDIKFITLLKPLQKILVRVPKKRLNSLAWCFNAIQVYIKKCEIPEDSGLVGKEKLLLDSNETVEKIISLYTDLLPFYETFIQELSIESDDLLERKAVLIKFLVQLLGKPLAYLDMEVFDGIKSKARVVAENIMCKIFKVIFDPNVLLDLRFQTENNELMKPNMLGMAVLFYLVYSEYLFIEKVPKVYCFVYLFQNSLYLVTTLIATDNEIAIEKGLNLAKALLEQVNFSKLPYLLLDSTDHNEFCQSLARVIIFNQLEHIRKFGLNIYRKYVLSFETRGIYLLIYNLMAVLNHSGLIGYTVTLYKDLLAAEFFKDEENMPPYFKGDKLLRLLREFCFLPKKEESDLIELSDQIIASLNLLRYLSIRDKKNITQIWNHFDILEETYFKPLRKGIDLSRAHYELKVKELVEETASGDKKESEAKVSVMVAGQSLLEMPQNEKLQVIYSSLTAFDIMDSLLSRVVECIETYKH